MKERSEVTVGDGDEEHWNADFKGSDDGQKYVYNCSNDKELGNEILL